MGSKPELKTQDGLALGVYWKVRSMEESVGWEWKVWAGRGSQKSREETRGARCWGPGDIDSSPKTLWPKNMLLGRWYISISRLPELVSGSQCREAR